jgi:hypothetical protein
MPVIDVIWDLPDDPHGNVQHIAEHGLIPADVEFIFNNPMKRSKSRSTGAPMISGQLPSGEFVVVIYQQIDELSVYPITAYFVEG